MTDRLVLWAVLLATEAALAIAFIARRRREVWGPRMQCAVVLTAMAAAVPWLGFALVGVMILGGGSPVAQMSLGNMDLWSLWFNTWPLLMLGSVGGPLILTASFCLTWRPYGEPLFFWARVVGLVLSLYTLWALLPLAPDA